MCNLTSRQGRGKSSGSAPSADTVSDTTKRLEVVPARELVFFRGRRHVSADDADGEVGNFGDGDFGAVELWLFWLAGVFGVHGSGMKLTLATRYCRLLVR